MSKKKTTMYAILLFVSGMILGASLLGVGIRLRWVKSPRGQRPPMQVVIMERLDRELDLSSEQEREVVPIVEEMARKFEALRAESRPRMEGIIDEAQSQAEPLLKEPQRGRLRMLRERARAHLERRPSS